MMMAGVWRKIRAYNSFINLWHQRIDFVEAWCHTHFRGKLYIIYLNSLLSVLSCYFFRPCTDLDEGMIHHPRAILSRQYCWLENFYSHLANKWK